MTCHLCGQELPRDRCPVPGCVHARHGHKVSRGEAGRAARDASSIEQATGFRVLRFMGRSEYEDHGVHRTLAQAMEAKRLAGRDAYGRPAMIYAIAPGRSALFVE